MNTRSDRDDGPTLAKCQRKCRNLEKRMAAAYIVGDFTRLNELADHYLRSYAASVVAVDKISRNRGACTPGIDGRVLRSEADKQAVVNVIRNPNSYRSQALRRVQIPKDYSKYRALGIPVQADKGMQQKVVQGVMPIAEMLADENSHGFRPNRRAQDAIQKCQEYLQDHSLTHVLDADIEACFDRIDHAFMLKQFPIQTFRKLIREWLEAGYVEAGMWFPTEAGTPQGGVISPMLANLALNGIEPLLAALYPSTRFVRYADDFVIFAKSSADVNSLTEVIKIFLAQRGLRLSPAKTVVKAVTEGFDFLGVRIQKTEDDVLLEPSPKSQKRLLQKIETFVEKSNPVSRWSLHLDVYKRVCGWMAYHEGWLAEDLCNAIWQRIDERIDCRWHQGRGWGQMGADALIIPRPQRAREKVGAKARIDAVPADMDGASSSTSTSP